jgi:hypothetical protein
VALFADTYKRDVSMGDLIFYNPASSPGSTNTGVIIGVAAHGNASQGDYSVTYWPGVAAAAASTYTIYRSNTPVIQCFPEPDREYIAIAEINNGNLSGMSIQRVRTPKMEIDFTANEYENLFTLGNPVSHLHIGPVSVSNGGILDDSLTLTGNVIPYMYLSGVLYNGNPSSPTILLNKASFSTQNTSAAINFNGSYYKDGIFTYAVSTLFNASETMVCKLVLRYGSIKLAKTITIPVQPAV